VTSPWTATPRDDHDQLQSPAWAAKNAGPMNGFYNAVIKATNREQTVSGVLPWTLMRNTYIYIYIIKLKRSFQSSSLWQGASTKIATPTRDLEINRANTTPGEYCWGWFNGLSNIWGGFCLSICRVLPRQQWQSTTQERNICEVYINEFLTVYSSEEVCENCHVGILEMRPSMTGKANPKTCR
jgi:hypothetical protein